MTTIILTIVGILLAAAAALMAFWYGGAAFDAGSTRAQAATVVNSVQNVANAIKLRNVTEGLPTAASPTLISDMVAQGWLSEVPPNPFGGVPLFVQDVTGAQKGAAYVVVATLPHSRDSMEICREISRQTRTPLTDVYYTMVKEGTGCGYASSDDSYFVAYATVH